MYELTMMNLPLYFLLFSLFVEVGSATPQTYYCGNQICTYDESVSCPVLIANNHFTGSCCSLKDTADGKCTVSVAGGICYWQPIKLCEGCTPGFGGKLLGSTSRLMGCPESDYGPVIKKEADKTEPPTISEDERAIETDEDQSGVFVNVGDQIDESEETANSGTMGNNEQQQTDNQRTGGTGFGGRRIPNAIWVATGLLVSVSVMAFFLFLRENSNKIKVKASLHQINGVECTDSVVLEGHLSLSSSGSFSPLENYSYSPTIDTIVDPEIAPTPSSQGGRHFTFTKTATRVDMAGIKTSTSSPSCMDEVLRSMPPSGTSRRKISKNPMHHC